LCTHPPSWFPRRRKTSLWTSRIRVHVYRRLRRWAQDLTAYSRHHRIRATTRPPSGHHRHPLLPRRTPVLSTDTRASEPTRQIQTALEACKCKTPVALRSEPRFRRTKNKRLVPSRLSRRLVSFGSQAEAAASSSVPGGPSRPGAICSPPRRLERCLSAASLLPVRFPTPIDPSDGGRFDRCARCLLMWVSPGEIDVLPLCLDSGIVRFGRRGKAVRANR
jgi:hypothetical protein